MVIGQRTTSTDAGVNDLGIDWHIVGSIKDFILPSPNEATTPVLVCGAKSQFMSFNVIQIKLNDKNSTAENLKRAQTIFKQFNPEYPFGYRFVDESYAKKFENEQRQGTLAPLSAGLTIFVSCLGLVGLSTYMAENRGREIGVRKLLGTSASTITTLRSQDFVTLIIISFAITSPVAWYLMSKWPSDLSCRIHIEWGGICIGRFFIHHYFYRNGQLFTLLKRRWPTLQKVYGANEDQNDRG